MKNNIKLNYIINKNKLKYHYNIIKIIDTIPYLIQIVFITLLNGYLNCILYLNLSYSINNLQLIKITITKENSIIGGCMLFLSRLRKEQWTVSDAIECFSYKVPTVVCWLEVLLVLFTWLLFLEQKHWNLPKKLKD